jgi:hypothetical protein
MLWHARSQNGIVMRAQSNNRTNQHVSWAKHHLLGEAGALDGADGFTQLSTPLYRAAAKTGDSICGHVIGFVQIDSIYGALKPNAEVLHPLLKGPQGSKLACVFPRLVELFRKALIDPWLVSEFRGAQDDRGANLSSTPLCCVEEHLFPLGTI